MRGYGSVMSEVSNESVFLCACNYYCWQTNALNVKIKLIKNCQMKLIKFYQFFDVKNFIFYPIFKKIANNKTSVSLLLQHIPKI